MVKRDMPKRFKRCAAILAVSSLTALASGEALASTDGVDPYESCLITRALALELSGIEVTEVVARAEQACSKTRGGLSEAAAHDVNQKARLAVIQQRSNARNTLRRS